MADLADHPFDPYRYGGELICIHVAGGRVCGRGEDEHAAGSAQVDEDSLEEVDGVPVDQGGV
jgi:hypothetical protein